MSPASTGPVPLATAAQTRELGRRLGALLHAGDLVLLTGELGAGKTTLAQGIAEGLRVRGPVTSPTFVIARVHPSLCGGPQLVHVDAYRLSGLEELDDLDLDADLADSVTVVEWGQGVAEQLAPDRVEVLLSRSPSDDPQAQERTVEVLAAGPRWDGARRSGLAEVLAGLAPLAEPDPADRDPGQHDPAVGRSR